MAIAQVECGFFNGTVRVSKACSEVDHNTKEINAESVFMANALRGFGGQVFQQSGHLRGLVSQVG